MRLHVGLRCRKSLLAGVLGACLFVISSAFAQDDGTPRVSKEVPISPNATINLVNLLVKKGILSQEQADGLIKQAEDDAFIARGAARDASKKAQDADKKAAEAAAAATPPGSKVVRYVPEIVKRQLRNELRKEVMAEAKKENWAAPNTFPEWVSRLRFYGDVRTRYEAQIFPKGNENTGTLVNYNAINTGSPFDTNQNNAALAPVRNVDSNRERLRLQARLGMEANLFDGFTAGVRIATGDSNVPVSTNATLGGGGGNFSKSAIWLDRGYINYSGFHDAVNFTAGRFDNPFFAPTDLIWANQLAFDGAALKLKHEILPGQSAFLVGGAFPLYDTLLNYPSNGTLSVNGLAGGNLPSQDKYLFGIQAGFASRIDENTKLTAGAAFYDYDNVQGQLSSPCNVLDTSSVCDTDLLRPSFAQYGNTYMGLRNIISTGVPLQPLYQYFGLASAFRVVDVTARLDLAQFNPVHVVFDGTYVQNVAFDPKLMENIAVNNRGASPDGVNPGQFNGGNKGAMGRVSVGYPTIGDFGQWSVFAAYKYLELDATLDAFTDPDFGLGGTNLKGYIIGGSFGLGKNVWTTARWMSANSIAGPPFAVDVFQLDLNGRF